MWNILAKNIKLNIYASNILCEKLSQDIYTSIFNEKQLFLMKYYRFDLHIIDLKHSAYSSTISVGIISELSSKCVCYIDI